jgi:hypothetical protein
LVVVPGLAMFSHRLPADLRATLRQRVWIPAHDAVNALGRLFSSAAAEPPAESPFVAAAAMESPRPTAPPPQQPTPEPAPAAASVPPPARVVMPRVSLAPANAIVPMVPAQGNGLAVPLATSRAVEQGFVSEQVPSRLAASQAPSPPAASAPEPPHQSWAAPAPQEAVAPHVAPDPPAAGADPSAALQKLADLGAFGVECHPLGNGSAGSVASCRMNVDPAGELQRMFHGRGPDRGAAMQSLVEQVEAWTRQQAAPATPL